MSQRSIVEKNSILADIKDLKQLLETLQAAKHLHGWESEPYIKQSLMLVNRIQAAVESEP